MITAATIMAIGMFIAGVRLKGRCSNPTPPYLRRYQPPTPALFKLTHYPLSVVVQSSSGDSPSMGQVRRPRAWLVTTRSGRLGSPSLPARLDADRTNAGGGQKAPVRARKHGSEA